MGTYCDLYLGNYSIYSSKNEPDIELIQTIFRSTDLFDIKRKRSVRLDADDFDNKNVTENAFYFQISVRELIQRLNAMGYSLEKAKLEFKKAKAKIIAEKKRDIKYYYRVVRPDDSFEKSMVILYNSIINYFENLDFDKLISEYKNIISKKISLYNFDTRIEKVNSLVDYIIEEEQTILSLNYFNYLYILRSILETQPPKKLLTYELTDLLSGGYINKKLINWKEVDKIIVLTEGSTDAFILKESLAKLYPHLSELYYFMDFQDSKSPGGAGHLVNIIKAFIGSGIRSKIIGIFDNDTAAEEALTQLEHISLPENLKVLQYPRLKFAQNYPTYAPTGLTYLDINGSACSIELYLGKDIIKDKKKYPIQWKGYSMKAKKYQGEIIKKEEIHSLFDKKLKLFDKDLKSADWSGVDLILQELFFAYQ